METTAIIIAVTIMTTTTIIKKWCKETGEAV